MTSTEIQIKLKLLGKSQKHLSNKFHRDESQISQAIRGKYPTLKNKIIKYISYLELSSNNKDVA